VYSALRPVKELLTRQISDKIFAEDFLFELDIALPLMPNPYFELPYLVIEDFLDERTCQQLIHSVQKDNNAKNAALRSRSKKLNQRIRKTKIYTLKRLHAKLYADAFEKARPQIEAFFALSLTTATDVQVLEYTKGSFYKAHADDSSVLIDQEGIIVGFKQVAPQRKLSSVMFASKYDATVTDDYSFNGGELIFNYFRDSENSAVMIKPKMGTLIVFASNPIYTHEVKTVQEGYRLTLVQWHDAIF
jgi:SM-20-related protein